MVTRKSTNGDVMVFMALMLFSFIWDECVVVDITKRWLNVWQGSYQAKSG
jgi:formate-dependent nitrite reductase membrane component NrfD